MEQLFLTVLQEAGPVVALIGFFVWKDYKREAMLNARLAQSEEYQRDIVAKLLERVVCALEHNNSSLDLLKERPCMLEGDEK